MDSHSTIVTSETELEARLAEELLLSSKESVAIVAGHLPLLYHDEGPGKRRAELGVTRWGEFSSHTFGAGCRLAQLAREQGKQSRVYLIVDDIIEAPSTSSWTKRVQEKVYKQNLPGCFRELSVETGETNLLAHQKRSFGTTPFFSEQHLRNLSTHSSGNECSVAYNAFLDSEITPEDYLVAFIPGQCKGNICEGVLDIRPDLDAMHVFFPHIETMGGLLETRTGFIKVLSGLPMSDCYEKGLVRYVRNS